MAYTTLISAIELAEHLDDPDWLIVDCRFSLTDTERGRRDYEEAHIPGALYAHLDEDLSGPVRTGQTGRHPLPDAEAFARQLGEWGVSDGIQVVAYDDYIACGGEAKAKEAGKWRLEGKDYIVQEGDVMHFRFNV